MAGPGDEIAAAEGRDRGDLRASHADREQATEQLKVAFVQGRLDKDEFDACVGQALTARTCVVAATFAYSVVMVFAVGRILTGWQERRSAGQLPPGPASGPGGQASQRPPTVSPGGQLPSPSHSHGHGQQHTASKTSDVTTGASAGNVLAATHPPVP